MRVSDAVRLRPSFCFDPHPHPSAVTFWLRRPWRSVSVNEPNASRVGADVRKEEVESMVGTGRFELPWLGCASHPRRLYLGNPATRI